MPPHEHRPGSWHRALRSISPSRGCVPRAMRGSGSAKLDRLLDKDHQQITKENHLTCSRQWPGAGRTADLPIRSRTRWSHVGCLDTYPRKDNIRQSEVWVADLSTRTASARTLVVHAREDLVIAGQVRVALTRSVDPFPPDCHSSSARTPPTVRPEAARRPCRSRPCAAGNHR